MSPGPRCGGPGTAAQQHLTPSPLCSATTRAWACNATRNAPPTDAPPPAQTPRTTLPAWACSGYRTPTRSSPPRRTTRRQSAATTPQKRHWSCAGLPRRDARYHRNDTAREGPMEMLRVGLQEPRPARLFTIAYFLLFSHEPSSCIKNADHWVMALDCRRNRIISHYKSACVFHFQRFLVNF